MIHAPTNHSTTVDEIAAILRELSPDDQTMIKGLAESIKGQNVWHASKGRRRPRHVAIQDVVKLIEDYTPGEIGELAAAAVNTHHPAPPPPKSLTLDEFAAELEKLPPGDMEARAALTKRMHDQYWRDRASAARSGELLPKYAQSLEVADSIALAVIGELAREAFLTYGDLTNLDFLMGLISETVKESCTTGNLAEFAAYANGQDADGEPLDD